MAAWIARHGVFEGLNDIPWAELSSAYGNADELPMWIRRLASKDADLRVQAETWLARELVHQGDLYSASAAAIPFLTRLVSEEDIQDKAGILRVLGMIADAARDYASYHLVDDGLVHEPDGLPMGETVDRVQEVLRAGVPVYVGLLAADDVEVRMRAADVASLSDSSRALAPILRAAFDRETDETVRANLVIANSRLSPTTEDDSAFFLSLMHSAESPLLRFVAALALVQSRPEEAPKEAIEIIARALSDDADTRSAYDYLACAHDFALYAILSALRQLEPSRLHFLVPMIKEAIQDAEDEHASVLVDIVLFIMFEGRRRIEHETRPAATLTNEQRAVLLDIVDNPKAWEWGNWHALHRYGLPTERESLAIYFDIPLPANLADPFHQAPDASARDLYFSSFEETGRRILDGLLPRLDQSATMSLYWETHSQNNVVMTINDRFLFRFPRHERAIEEMEREIGLLRALQGKLPLPIPDPIYSSLEPREVGQAFMGYEKLPGKPLYREMLESVPGEEAVQRLGEQLGHFLWALHHLPVDEVFDFPLPVVATRETWERMYIDIRAKLFPRMRVEAREAVAAHFETNLADAATFAYTPAPIHGDFGASNILYDAKARSIGGIIDWSSAGLGDPAIDIAALVCPASYGEDFAPRLTGVYPGVADLLPRASFYIGTFALQAALFGVERGDERALARGLEQYI